MLNKTDAAFCVFPQNHKESKWRGHKRLDFKFEGKNAIVVLPENFSKNCKWLLKTEYFDAFADFEETMVSRGYALAHIENDSRWCLEEDTDRRERFREYLHKQLGFNEKTVAVGMSCGGMQAIYFAAKYPTGIAALYLDAPVVNLLSCPCHVGREYSDPADYSMYDEFVRDTGKDLKFLLGYRNHPLDNIRRLVENKIPCFLVCGDSDDVVPYEENGIYIAEAYKKSGVPFFSVIKKGCGHHPHGLEDSALLIEFTEKFYLNFIRG